MKGFTSFVVLLIASLSVTGCGPEIITLDTRTDYVPSAILIDAPGIFISNVVDNRNVDPFVLGHISGLVSGKKYDIYLDDSLSVLIKNYFNDLIINHIRTDPVEVEILTFALVENFSKKDEYHLAGSFLYRYINEQAHQDTFIAAISTNISRDPAALAENINAALRTNLLEFIDMLQSQRAFNPAFRSPDYISPGISNDTSHLYDNRRDNGEINSRSIIDSIAVPNQETRSNIVFDEPVPVPQTIPDPRYIGAGISYYTGDKIKGGMQIEFRMSWQKPDWEYGFSVGFLYLTFLNWPYEGYLWALNLPWNMKYMLSDKYISPYIGGTIKLIAGRNEERTANNFNNYNSGVASMFWGPTFEESFGLAVNRSIFIEAGVFEMFLFNTDLLPRDLGFRLSLHFTVAN